MGEAGTLLNLATTRPHNTNTRSALVGPNKKIRSERVTFTIPHQRMTLSLPTIATAFSWMDVIALFSGGKRLPEHTNSRSSSTFSLARSGSRVNNVKTTEAPSALTDRDHHRK